MGVPATLAVFVVDDSQVIRERYRSHLAELPHLQICGYAATAKAAIEGIVQSRPDVVVIDLDLENSSGVEVLKALRGFEPKPELIVVSTGKDESVSRRCLQLGASRVFEKSTGFLQLMDYLATLHS